MTQVQEIRRQASALSTREKVELAAELLESLPPILDNDDEGVAEALRRNREMEQDPAAAVTWDQLRRGTELFSDSCSDRKEVPSSRRDEPVHCNHERAP